MKRLIVGGLLLLVSHALFASCDVIIKAERFYIQGAFSQIMGREDNIDADPQITMWFANTLDDAFSRTWAAAAASGARIQIHEETGECGGLASNKFRYIGEAKRGTGDFSLINP